MLSMALVWHPRRRSWRTLEVARRVGGTCPLAMKRLKRKALTAILVNWFSTVRELAGTERFATRRKYGNFSTSFAS